MTTIEHGFNLHAVRRELDRETWEDDPENPGSQIRRIYLGDIFSLTPSGKMYTPFACSNVDACETCRGTGHVTPRRYKRRTQKKHAARHARIMRRFDALYGNEPAKYPDPAGVSADRGMPSLGLQWRPTNKRAAFAYIDRQPKRFRLRYLTIGTACTACAGCGSREAHLDELWQEAAEEGIAATPGGGVFLSWKDGEAFAVETRDAPEDDDSDEDTAGADASESEAS